MLATEGQAVDRTEDEDEDEDENDCSNCRAKLEA